jgi:hypothetical protein
MRIKELLEGYTTPPLRSDIKDTLPPTLTIPELPNSNGYDQYRYLLNIAAAEAVERGEVKIDQESSFNQSITVVCYAPQEMEIVKKTDAIMGVNHTVMVASGSREPKWVNKTSTVRPFKDLDN